MKPARLALLTALFAVMLAAVPSAGAWTFDQTAQQVTGIANSKWVTGDSGQTYGTNCSTAILGSSYPEVMEMAFSGYGGKANSVRVGDQYWARLSMAVTGNPCPKGSDIIAIDLAMPPGTTFDATRPIRCFSTPRHSDDYAETTNEGWDMRPIGINAYGRTCPLGLTPSSTGHGVGLDYRGLASGQKFMMYVPVVSSQPLVGMGNSDHRFVWLVNPSLAYDYFGTQTWTNVFPAGSSTPYFYFAREPSVIPYWNKSAPADQENMVELFANLFSNFQAGSLCWDLYEGTGVGGTLNFKCEQMGTNWISTVTSDSDSWFLKGSGPNGGATPIYFTKPTEYGQTFTIRYRFTYSGGTIYSAPVTFKSLSGPDEDNDGVANDGTDQCPTQIGEPPSGCPTSMASEDPDGDGLVGEKDKCPTLMMIGAVNGCPTLTGKLGKLPVFKRSKLAKGVKFPVTCSLDTPISASLNVSKSVAKKLKIKLKKGAKTATIASAKGKCTAAKGAKLKLKLSSKSKQPVGRSKKAIKAALAVRFSPTGGVEPVSASAKLTLK